MPPSPPFHYRDRVVVPLGHSHPTSRAEPTGGAGGGYARGTCLSLRSDRPPPRRPPAVPAPAGGVPSNPRLRRRPFLRWLASSNLTPQSYCTCQYCSVVPIDLCWCVAVGLDAAAPLRVGSLPRSRSHGGGDFARPEARNGEASLLLCALGRILPDHQKVAQHDLLKAVVLSTMSILAVPLEASAETCPPANSLANMPVFIAVALIGAAVGGLLARQRKEELKRLNNQLRQINTALRRQAQIESFAPGLTYAPVGRAGETEVIVDPRKQQLVTNLRNGKNYLRNQDLDKAVMEFRTALELAESIGDRFEEKKAARGLGASLQRLEKYTEAMNCYYKVLELSKETGEDSGCTEAYGAIADCYAELGDLERAAKLYDKYISRLQPGD